MHRFYAALRKQLPPLGSPRAYLIALGLLALAGLARMPLEPALNQRLPPYLTIYPAVVLASFIGGVRVGGLSAIGGGVLAWFLWIAPLGETWKPPPYAFFVFGSYFIAMTITVVTCSIGRLLLDDVSALEAQRHMQARETVHRIKNLITVIQAIASKASRDASSLEAFRHTFSERMVNLGRAQNLLLRAEWKKILLQELVQQALAPFLPDTRLRFANSNPIVVPAHYVAGLSLALYELATNALKHGALADDEGLIEVEWRASNERAFLRWSERSTARPISAAPSAGFGTMLINNALGGVKDTKVRYEVDEGRVVAEFSWPL